MFGSKYEWLEPKREKYIQSSINWNAGEKWSNVEIPYVIRRYDPYGNIDINLTLNLINEYFDDKKLLIKEIPKDNKYDID